MLEEGEAEAMQDHLQGRDHDDGQEDEAEYFIAQVLQEVGADGSAEQDTEGDGSGHQGRDITA